MVRWVSKVQKQNKRNGFWHRKPENFQAPPPLPSHVLRDLLVNMYLPWENVTFSRNAVFQILFIEYRRKQKLYLLLENHLQVQRTYGFPNFSKSSQVVKFR